VYLATTFVTSLPTAVDNFDFYGQRLASKV
jgi:hypothetical protein